eukprot:scaffold332_cov117-Cylindrotheca_fusiformis.AAC.8
MIPRLCLFAISSISFVPYFALAGTVDMGKINVCLTSSVSEDNDVLSAHILSTTTNHINDYFKAYYRETQTTDYFSSAILRVSPFEIQGEAEKYVTTVTFAGMLSFKVDPAPSHSFVDALTVSAFQEGNLDIYIDSLLGSESRFLSNLLNVVVEVHDNPMIEKRVDDNSGAKEQNPAEQGEDGLLTGWSAALIYGMAVLIGVILAVALFYFRRCHCCCNRLIDGNPVELKTIDVPNNVDRRIQKQNKEKDRPNPPSPLPMPIRIAKTKDSFYSGNLPPSPEHSITSQDSSKFTYNPDEMSVFSYSMDGASIISKTSLGLGNFHNVIGPDVSVSFDPQSGRPQRRESNVPVSFGNGTHTTDPCYKGLNQIEEGDEKAYAACKTRFERHKKASEVALQIRKPKRLFGRPVSKLQATQSFIDMKNESNYENESEGITESSSSPSSWESDDSSKEVIDDLKDLSFQIQMHRRGRK